MAGYFGTDQQQALQQVVEKARSWIYETPGACNPGRFLGADDPDRLGWDRIFEILERDQVFGFRLLPSDAVENVTNVLSERGYRIDCWDVFVADCTEAKQATSSLIANGPPAGYEEISLLEDGAKAETRGVQAFMASNGIAPFSGSMLVGEFGPATTVIILDGRGEVAAAAHGYFPHNSHSLHNESAWGGLVAVSPDHRGSGLGKYVNAKMVANCISILGARSVHEFVAATNIPSRKMVEASGLRLDPTLTSGIAVAGGERFTS